MHHHAPARLHLGLRTSHDEHPHDPSDSGATQSPNFFPEKTRVPPASTTDPIKVGIVGYGFSTKCFHLPFILPNAEPRVYAFLQRAAPPATPAEVKGWGHCTFDFPDAKHCRTKDEFFAVEEIELVIV